MAAGDHTRWSTLEWTVLQVYVCANGKHWIRPVHWPGLLVSTWYVRASIDVPEAAAVIERFGRRRRSDPRDEIEQVPLFRKDDPNVLFETPVRLTPENVKPSDLTPTNTPQRELTPEDSKKAGEIFKEIIGGNSGFMGGNSDGLPTKAKISSVTNIFNPTEPRSPFRDFITGYPTGIGFA